MPFTDDQFKEFIKAMDTREMLIRIDENTKNFHQSIGRRLDDHINEDLKELGVHTRDIEKSHIRIDVLEKEQTKLRGIVIGVGTLATIILSMLQLWIAFVK
ncbi:hypothetical protein KW791_00620 [Candidatus Parcubacteria bacterium]|nr:hypothetical protein [Candidatus Parcubacteria bacterium]